MPVFWCVYAVSLLVAGSRLSLWLDEVIQLLSTRDQGFHTMIVAIASDPGQVPFGYLVQSEFLHWAGFSALAARLPSIACALISCRILSRISNFAAVIFALLPLHFRYACEARPYEMALCASVVALWIFIKLDQRWSAGWQVAYTLLLIAGLYCQPYSIFPAVGCLLWCVLDSHRTRRTVWMSASSLAVAGLCFLPWYQFSHPLWLKTMAVPRPNFSAHSFAVIFRELVGGGYVQSILVAAACLLWLSNAQNRCFGRLFWLCFLASSLAAPILFDFHFGYFLANRQWIFALPGIAVLASQSNIECETN